MRKLVRLQGGSSWIDVSVRMYTIDATAATTATMMATHHQPMFTAYYSLGMLVSLVKVVHSACGLDFTDSAKDASVLGFIVYDGCQAGACAVLRR